MSKTRLFEADGRTVEAFSTCEAFLDAGHAGSKGCLLVDAVMPGMSGLALLQRMKEKKYLMPAIMITGYGNVPMAVQAMHAGAVDFVEKPAGADELLAHIRGALERKADPASFSAIQKDALDLLATLTPRQRQVMDLVLAGHPSKNIAADMGISQRTVENHRAAIMHKTQSKTIPALVRLALAAGYTGEGARE